MHVLRNHFSFFQSLSGRDDAILLIKLDFCPTLFVNLYNYVIHTFLFFNQNFLLSYNDRNMLRYFKCVFKIFERFFH